jgi:hypothetical protein
MSNALCLSIFEDPKAYEDRRRQKLMHREMYAAALVVPTKLRWLERPFTFDRDDHPDHIVEATCFPLVVQWWKA